MIEFQKHYDFSYFKVLIVGFFIGILTAFLLWGTYLYFSPSSVAPRDQNIYPVLGKSVTARNPHTLSLSEPSDEILVNTDVVIVAGQTSPTATVVAVNGELYKMVQADAYGVFNLPIGVIEGINQITVTSFSDQGEEQSLFRTVVYSKESDEL